MDERHLLIVRHPETEANVDGRFVGRGDAPYTMRGRRQASLAIEAIERFAPSTVWSSPLRRTLVVARGAAERLGLEPVVDERLTELDFGVAEGLTYEQTVERGIAFVFDACDVPVAEGGESRRDILDRSAEVVDCAIGVAERVAIVTHGGVFRSMMVHLLGLPMSAIWAFDIRNASCAEFRIIDGHALLSGFWHVD